MASEGIRVHGGYPAHRVDIDFNLVPTCPGAILFNNTIHDPDVTRSLFCWHSPGGVVRPLTGALTTVSPTPFWSITFKAL